MQSHLLTKHLTEHIVVGSKLLCGSRVGVCYVFEQMPLKKMFDSDKHVCQQSSCSAMLLKCNLFSCCAGHVDFDLITDEVPPVL